jgi:predicted nucleotidyltransferase component of viral defense system
MAALTIPNRQRGSMEFVTLSQPHWEALTAETKNAFHLVSRLPFIQRYYLAGGTGLALHLGHRFSVVLDLFSPDSNAVGPDERAVLRNSLEEPSLAITYDKDMTFVANWRGVGVSFFCLSLYPLVQPLLLLDGVPIACLAEIGAMKLAAIIDRGTRKDLVDLYYILQHVSLDDLFQVAAVKYARVRTFAISATRALAYFDDAEALPMPEMLDRTPWKKMKRFLEHQAVEAGSKRLHDLWA